MINIGIAKSPLKWVGGKSKLINKILPLIPEHKGYVEVFGGSGVVLLNKEQSKWEVLNDFDGNLMNFWKVIQTKPREFVDSFKFELVSRQLFDEYKAKYKTDDYESDVERAKIFYYLVKAGFGADMKNPVFGTGKDRNRLRLEQIVDDIKNTYKRIQKTTIENRSFEKLFPTYDSEDTFFYLDPPYRKTKQYATGKFTDEQYEALRDCLANAEGKFLMTINDDEYIRELFQDFYITDHEVYYSVCKSSNGRVNFSELIITNYDIAEII